MGFSSEWNEQYKNNRQMSIWPWSHLISLCLRHTPLGKCDEQYCILEVGCGAGANLPFFLSYTNNVFAVDGSEYIISLLQKRFESIKKNLMVADFTVDIPFDRKFDLIVDRGASVHNDIYAIEDYLDAAFSKLKANGYLVITDWFSTEDHNFIHNEKSNKDTFTMSDFTAGSFANLGKVHFFNRAEIQRLTTKFQLIHLEHTTTQVEGVDGKSAVWCLVLQKLSDN
ncbi:class I SAM-dependent methyltransferase [Pseudoalteromonas mariniglutinosa]|uniref:class I SAM-dependent methyltransferase n=1 Tax=Pseudoalteromonas mariniglutinosa TaxID=206042 RepID=UPI00384ABD9E